MQPHMGSLINHKQVLDSVIEFVSVDVVYSFVTLQWPSQEFRRYDTVLKNVASIYADELIAGLGDQSSALPMPGDRSGTLIGTGTGTEPTLGTDQLPLLAREFDTTRLATADATRSLDASHHGTVYYFVADF